MPLWNKPCNEMLRCSFEKISERQLDVRCNGIKRVAEKHREYLVKMQLLTLSGLLVAATISTVASDKGN